MPFHPPEVAENEIEILDRLRLAKPHKNIVGILRHGQLTRSHYYYFDLELCQYNLHSYKGLMWEPTPAERAISNPDDRISLDWTKRMREVWKIMRDVVNGLQYLHGMGIIHRDLKPRNGIPF